MRDLFKSMICAASVALLFVSCNSDDDDTKTTEPLGDYETGIFVTSEGGSVSGTVDFISEDFSSVENGVYQNVNGENLGTYLESAYFDDETAYVVVDNASTIYAVNKYTFEKIGTITTGLSMPRFMTVSDGKGYVTNWGDPYDSTDDFVAVVNLESLAVESTIAVGEGPERILSYDGKVYVTHKGGYNTNNIVSVIETSSETVSTIEVEDKPDEIFVNDAGDIVVLSHGATLYDASWNYIGDTVGAISKIDPSNNTLELSLEFVEGSHPGLMYYYKGVLYYELSGTVYTMSDSDTALPTTGILDLGGIYAYGMAVDDNNLYVINASFSEMSDLIVYDLNSLTEAYTFDVGLGASKIYFAN
ncbi:hypothetical protein NBRC110019_07050 [Neptunitalea chrysea]|uniref:Cell surface protein n=1 Tax=Neptunitalea chrysea TaxID=1647581 RepID=A0A9W6EUF5_9FLAO|nr:DUF5074 domain-containing protein [Neptunitalea chrysea]GLB51666.1 hypothetical protein NBRC110019_07050 [Neptunitalea chrysea]